MIADRLSWSNELPVWSWNWTEPLSSSEEHQLLAFKVLLVGVIYPSDSSDSWHWIPASYGIFSVKSCYDAMLHSTNSNVLDPNVLVTIEKLWKIDAPSKALFWMETSLTKATDASCS
jgi:hypothetical protein